MTLRPGCSVERKVGRLKEDIGLWIKEAENRQKILDLLLPALKAAEELRKLKSLDYIVEKELVIAKFADGQEVTINVAGDSDMALLYDVVVKLWH